MNRRELMALLAGAAAAPGIARAQQRPKKIPRIGIIDDGAFWNPFRDALGGAGYIDGQTVVFETRKADGNPDRLIAAAAELVQLPVDLIATYGTPATRAAKAATSTIPILMIGVGDPVTAGLVQSLAHPGGNVTGNTVLSPELAPKRLQLIKEILPSAKQTALLWNPDNASNRAILEQLRSAASRQGLMFTAVEARTANDLDGAFAILAGQRPDVVLITNDAVHQSRLQKIISLLFRHGLPSMFQDRDSAAAGGLMSYGANFPDMFRQGAFFTQKILQGILPADLPVQTPQRYQLVINLRTAKAIGVTISEAIQLQADEVIE